MKSYDLLFTWRSCYLTGTIISARDIRRLLKYCGSVFGCVRSISANEGRYLLNYRPGITEKRTLATCVSRHLLDPTSSHVAKKVIPFYKWISFGHVMSVVRNMNHDDVIKWKHFPRYWPFVRGIHRSPVNSQHKSQWRGALMFSLICSRVNNGEVGDLRRHRAHYDVTVMCKSFLKKSSR